MLSDLKANISHMNPSKYAALSTNQNFWTKLCLVLVLLNIRDVKVVRNSAENEVLFHDRNSNNNVTTKIQYTYAKEFIQVTNRNSTYVYSGSLLSARHLMQFQQPNRRHCPGQIQEDGRTKPENMTITSYNNITEVFGMQKYLIIYEKL